MTGAWFDSAGLDEIARRYESFPVERLGYATVKDYVDSFEHINPLACAQGDLKDVQRPWTFKAILASIPHGGRLLEIGAGQPFVADLLASVGYEVWVVDPYDGSGNGPVEYEAFREACPEVRFVRAVFSDELIDIPAHYFDCVYSISVLEHLDLQGIDTVVRGMSRCLTASGISIHAVDHVHRGVGADEHLEGLRHLASRLGFSMNELERLLEHLGGDTETYYLSAESHNRWRGQVPYEDFPMRVCVSIHMATGRNEMASDADLVRRRASGERQTPAGDHSRS